MLTINLYIYNTFVNQWWVIADEKLMDCHIYLIYNFFSLFYSGNSSLWENVTIVNMRCYTLRFSYFNKLYISSLTLFKLHIRISHSYWKIKKSLIGEKFHKFSILLAIIYFLHTKCYEIQRTRRNMKSLQRLSGW